MSERSGLIVLLVSLTVLAGGLSAGVAGARDGCSLAGGEWYGYTPLTHTKVQAPSGAEACTVSIFRGDGSS